MISLNHILRLRIDLQHVEVSMTTPRWLINFSSEKRDLYFSLLKTILGIYFVVMVDSGAELSDS